MGSGAICPLGSAGSESCLAMAEYSDRTVRRPVSNEVMSVKCSWKSEHDLIKKVFFFSFFSHSFWGIPTSKNNGHSWPSVLHMQPRTTDAQWNLFSSKSTKSHLGLGRQYGQMNFGAFGVFLAVSPLSMFSINQPLFLQQTKPLYPNCKYLFGIGIWIWAAKN